MLVIMTEFTDKKRETLQTVTSAETEQRDAWLEENRAALESSNRYVEESGLPLGEYRMF